MSQILDDFVWKTRCPLKKHIKYNILMYLTFHSNDKCKNTGQESDSDGFDIGQEDFPFIHRQNRDIHLHFGEQIIYLREWCNSLENLTSQNLSKFVRF